MPIIINRWSCIRSLILSRIPWRNECLQGNSVTSACYHSETNFYYPEVSRPIMRNMELWKLIIRFRNEHSGKKLTFKEKELFYQDAHKVLEKALFLLEKFTLPVTSPVQIAQVSSSNADYSIALTIAEAFEKVGPGGLKMVVEGSKFHDELELASGLQLSLVKINPMFITNCSGIDVFTQCSLILYNDRLESIEDIQPYVNAATSEKKQCMFIFSSCHQKVIHDLVKYKLNKKLDFVAVEIKQPNDVASSLLMDVSILTDTKLASKNPSNADIEEVLRPSAIAYFTEDEIVLHSMRLDENKLLVYMSGIIDQYSSEGANLFQTRMKLLFNNKIALIKVGGIDKVDIRKRMGMAVDTLGRAEQAVNYGLIVGDGRCLLDIIEQISNSIVHSRQMNGGTIVVDAMKFFYNVMYAKSQSYYDLSSAKSILVPRFFGYDNKTKQYVNLIADGILDPKSYFAQSLMFAKLKCMQYKQESGRDTEDD